MRSGHPPLGRTPDTGWEAWEGVHPSWEIHAGVGRRSSSGTRWRWCGRRAVRSASIARELGCGESSLGYWLTKDRQSRAAADPERFAAEQAESEEIKRLRRRVAELEVEREILKRSAAWWVKESMP